MSNRVSNALAKNKGFDFITKKMVYYDAAVNKALMLTFEDPTASTENNDVQTKSKQTENLLSKFPVQPFKSDFIDGFKIRGRQKPLDDFRKDLKGRLKQIGGGIGDGLFEEQLENDDSRQNINQQSPLNETSKGATQGHKSSNNVAKNLKTPASTLQAQREKDIEQKMQESHASGFISNQKKLGLDKMREITRKVQDIVQKDEQKKIQSQLEGGKQEMQSQSNAAVLKRAMSPGQPENNGGASSLRQSPGIQSTLEKGVPANEEPATGSIDDETTINSEMRSKVHQLKDQIDAVVKYRVANKNARQVKLGRKIVDKEGDLYEKMVFFPEIKEPVVRKKPTQDFHHETMLFKANAVKLSDFLAKRMSEKHEHSERLNKMYADSFSAPISTSTKPPNAIQPLMFLDQSATYFESGEQSVQQVFITSADIDEDTKSAMSPVAGISTKRSLMRSRNAKEVSQSIAIPKTVQGSPLREAIYITNKSVRRFKFMSSYSKNGLSDSQQFAGKSMMSEHQQPSTTTESLNQFSKDRVNKLRGMINLPKIQKKGMNQADCSQDDGLNGDSIAATNKLSMIKELMENTTQMLTANQTNSSPKPVSLQYGAQGSFNYNDDLVTTDSPKLSKHVSKIFSKRPDLNHMSGQGTVGGPSRHFSSTRQPSIFKPSSKNVASPGFSSPLSGGFSLNKMNDSLDYSSQLMGNSNYLSISQRLQKQVAKQIEQTKDLRSMLNNSIESIKQDLVATNPLTEEQALQKQLYVRMKNKMQLSLGIVQTEDQRMASLLGITLHSQHSDSHENLNASTGFSNQGGGSTNKRSGTKNNSVQNSPARRVPKKSKESKLNVIFEMDTIHSDIDPNLKLRNETD